MLSSPSQLRRDAQRIWLAGVEAVRSQRLVLECLEVDAGILRIGNSASLAILRLPLSSIRRIVVVGAGKAGTGMAEAVEEALGPKLMVQKQLAGWVNVPADCCGTVSRPCHCEASTVGVARSGDRATTGGSAGLAAGRQPAPQYIHLHPARPAGVNEPTAEGVAGSEEILRLVGSLGPDDLCLCLISGGGSALMPAPVEGITLADKLAVTRHLSAAGANIEQLNTVRKQLSRIKGGGLLRACRAGRLVSLIISDVLGDPLDVIASGPTVPDSSTPQAALDVLEQFHAREAGISPAVFEYLEKAAHRGLLAPGYWDNTTDVHVRASNFIIGNNATAVAAAAEEAKRLGYAVAATSAAQSEGLADDVGRELAETALAMRAGGGRQECLPHCAGRQECLPHCLVSGGEPVVKLAEPSRRGLGGRNQQLVLAAALRLMNDRADRNVCPTAEGIVLLSGGTDGEDGPTDAAGAFFDSQVLAAARQKNLDPADYLARNDAYHFFSPLGALLKTGPTQTNVCDLRVVVADY